MRNPRRTASTRRPDLSGRPAAGTEDGSFDTLTELLWRERELLEKLLFTVNEQQLVLLSARSRWLAMADSEIMAAVEPLRSHELLRGLEVTAVARTLGLPPDATLHELAAAAPQPWRTTLGELHEQLCALTHELDKVLAANRSLLTESAGAR